MSDEPVKTEPSSHYSPLKMLNFIGALLNEVDCAGRSIDFATHKAEETEEVELHYNHGMTHLIDLREGLSFLFQFFNSQNEIEFLNMDKSQQIAVFKEMIEDEVFTKALNLMKVKVIDKTPEERVNELFGTTNIDAVDPDND